MVKVSAVEQLETKVKQDVKTKDDFYRVSIKAYENRKLAIGNGYFEMIPTETYKGILLNLYEDGKKLSYAKSSGVLALYLLFVSKMQKNKDKSEDKRNPKLLDRYECAVYSKKADIYNELNMDKKTFDRYVKILIENGYICQMVGTEKSSNCKYYWYVFFTPEPEFCKTNSSSKLKNPKAFGGNYGSNTKRKNS